MNLQRINVKLFTDGPEKIDLAPFLGIFARWRDEATRGPSHWVDLADYAHVAKGPGVMLIGKRGNLSLNLADPGPGILYENRQGLENSIERRIQETFRRCAELSLALTAESEYPGALAPRPGFWELTFNDRLETPNTEATDRMLRPAVEKLMDGLLGADNYILIREADPARRYGFTIHSEGVRSLEEIAVKL